MDEIDLNSLDSEMVTPTSLDRDRILEKLAVCMGLIENKLQSGRYRDREREQNVREWVKLMVYSCQVASGILKYGDRDEISAKIKEIERIQEMIQ